MRRSVRFGMSRPAGRRRERVERAGRRLGMELHALEPVAVEPLAGAVVQRHVRDVAVGDHGEAVVLDRDEHAAGLHVLHRMVRAAVTEGQLERRVAEREPEQLVAEADAEERHAAEQRADRLDLVGEHGRVAGAVRDQHRARLRLEDRVGIPGARDDVRLEPGVGEPARDRALRAEVDDDDPRAGADREGLGRPDLAVERPAVDRRLGERARLQLLDRRRRRARSAARRRRGSAARACACRRR